MAWLVTEHWADNGDTHADVEQTDIVAGTEWSDITDCEELHFAVYSNIEDADGVAAQFEEEG